MGHVLPLLQLAYWAAKSGIKATFLASDVPLKRAPALQHENLEVVALPSTGVSYEDYAKGPSAVMPLYQQMIAPATAHLERLAGEGACAVVASPFIFFGPPVAKRLGMKWTTLVDTSLIGAAVTLRVAADAEGKGPSDTVCEGGVDLAGYMRVGKEDIVNVFGEEGLTGASPTVWLAKGFADLIAASDALLSNTVAGLDADLPGVNELGAPIGPLFTHTVESLPDDVAAFLDKQARRSVVYIAFGTFGAPSDDFNAQLAAVLQSTAVPFVWVTKATVPSGPHGLVTAWAPQAAVLQHPSVGLFFSHGGWNSVLEALAGGVPMLLRPSHAEQVLNTRVIEEKYAAGHKGGPEAIGEWAQGGWAAQAQAAEGISRKIKQAQVTSQANWDKWIDSTFG